MRSRFSCESRDCAVRGRYEERDAAFLSRVDLVGVVRDSTVIPLEVVNLVLEYMNDVWRIRLISNSVRLAVVIYGVRPHLNGGIHFVHPYTAKKPENVTCRRHVTFDATHKLLAHFDYEPTSYTFDEIHIESLVHNQYARLAGYVHGLRNSVFLNTNTHTTPPASIIAPTLSTAPDLKVACSASVATATGAMGAMEISKDTVWTDALLSRVVVMSKHRPTHLILWIPWPGFRSTGSIRNPSLVR